MARGNPKALSLGPGYLRYGVLDAAEPVDLATDWDEDDWSDPFYTEEGSEFSYNVSFDPVTVAEELDQLDDVATGREMSVAFAMAEVTAANLKTAMNGGTITPDTSGTPAFDTFEPPELGSEIYKSLGFESEDGEERWVFRQGKQTGQIQMQRRKGANKTLIAVQFKLYKPTAGGSPFKAIIARTRNAS